MKPLLACVLAMSFFCNFASAAEIVDVYNLGLITSASEEWGVGHRATFETTTGKKSTLNCSNGGRTGIISVNNGNDATIDLNMVCHTTILELKNALKALATVKVRVEKETYKAISLEIER